MPIIEMHLLTGRTTDQKRRVAAAVTQAVARELDVNPQSVRILITEHGPEDFSVAGVTAGARAQVAAGVPESS
jgi:4-oxalocrotonate tautomerase